MRGSLAMLLAAAALSATANPAAGQRALVPGCPAAPGQVYFEFQVSTPAVFRSGPRDAPRPVPPKAGEWPQFQFVVDTLGRVEPGSFRGIRGTDSALVAVARQAAASWHFRPAVWNNCVRARQLVQARLAR